MLDAESRVDNATARSIASFVGNGGGLPDLSVKESEGPSVCWNVGVKDRVCLSRSVPVPSLCVLAEDGRSSSVWGRLGR